MMTDRELSRELGDVRHKLIMLHKKLNDDHRGSAMMKAADIILTRLHTDVHRRLKKDAQVLRLPYEDEVEA